MSVTASFDLRTCLAASGRETGFGDGWALYPPLDFRSERVDCGPDWLSSFWSAAGHGLTWMLVFGAFGVWLAVLARRAGYRGQAVLQIPVFAIALSSLGWLLHRFYIGSQQHLYMSVRRSGGAFFDPSGGRDPFWLQNALWWLGQWEVSVLGFVLLTGAVLWLRRGIRLRWPIQAWLVVPGMALLLVASWAVGMNIYRSGEGIGWLPLQKITLLVLYGLIAWPVLSAIVSGIRKALTRPRRPVPILWAAGLFLCLVYGVISSWALSSVGVDQALHDTYYVHAQVQYVVALGWVIAVFGIGFAVFERIFGMGYSQKLAMGQAVLFLAGCVLAVLPTVALSAQGMPSRYVDYPDTFEFWNQVSSIGFTLILLSLILFVAVLVEAFVRRRPPASPPASI
jgi:cytochrome c oxidase subunit I